MLSSFNHLQAEDKGRSEKDKKGEAPAFPVGSSVNAILVRTVTVIKAGHDVTIWNRTADATKPLVVNRRLIVTPKSASQRDPFSGLSR